MLKNRPGELIGARLTNTTRKTDLNVSLIRALISAFDAYLIGTDVNLEAMEQWFLEFKLGIGLELRNRPATDPAQLLHQQV